jgi:prephenate dehydratase
MRKILVLDAYTNGHEAAHTFMRLRGWHRKDCDIVFCGSHANLLKRLSEGPAFGVVPVRNTIAGEVTEVTRSLAAHRERGFCFDLIAETDLQINHCLLAPVHVTGVKQLERVMSHEKAIQQCGAYLDAIGLTPDRRSKRDSTGNAAKVVSKLAAGIMIGAIASKAAAKAYGLKILAEKIQDVKKNRTTFLLLENKAAIRPVTVGIIGVAGRFGSVLKAFFEGAGCKVLGSDPSLKGGPQNSEVVKSSDAVIFCVPIKAMPLVVRSVQSHVREGQLLMDITSIKQPAMAEMLKSKAQVVGLHPMFAPETSFDGQTIVVCPARLTDPAWKTWVMNVLSATGCKLKWSTAEEHDSYMATVQAMPHLANLVSAVLIMEAGYQRRRALRSPVPSIG